MKCSNRAKRSKIPTVTTNLTSPEQALKIAKIYLTRLRQDPMTRFAAIRTEDVYQYKIVPVPAPRQVRSDAWDARPAVARYRAFKDEVRIRHISLPRPYYHVVFVLPMPKSWPEAKRMQMLGQPHRARPDKDNLEKALLDAVFPIEDSHVYDGRATKVWGAEGEIVVSNKTLNRLEFYIGLELCTAVEFAP